jgi:hypothetical protein
MDIQAKFDIRRFNYPNSRRIVLIVEILVPYLRNKGSSDLSFVVILFVHTNPLFAEN